MSRSRAEVKREMRELRADPGQVGARAALQRLLGELARLDQEDDVVTITPKAKPRREPDPVPKDDTSGWPLELRLRLRQSAYDRTIDGWGGRDA